MQLFVTGSVSNLAASVLFTCSLGLNGHLCPSASGKNSQRACTSMVVTAIKNNIDFVVCRYSAQASMVKTQGHHEHAIAHEVEFDSVLVSFSDDARHAVKRAIDGRTSIWLTVMQIACRHLDLSLVCC